jgi:hypothetical protein
MPSSRGRPGRIKTANGLGTRALQRAALGRRGDTVQDNICCLASVTLQVRQVIQLRIPFFRIYTQALDVGRREKKGLYEQYKPSPAILCGHRSEKLRSKDGSSSRPRSCFALPGPR